MSHVEKVNEWIAKLDAGYSTKRSKQVKLTTQINSAKLYIQDLQKQLNTALHSVDGDDEKLLSELREAEMSLQQLEDLQKRLNNADISHCVTSDDLIKTFRQATSAIQEELKIAVASAHEAKQVYEDSLAAIERVCQQQQKLRGRIDHAARVHLGKVIDGQLPKLTVPREPYLSFHHYAERRN